MKYYIKEQEQWNYYENHSSAFGIIEDSVHCAACHKWLCSFRKPTLALCVDCFESNKDLDFVIRQRFGQ